MTAKARIYRCGQGDSIALNINHAQMSRAPIAAIMSIRAVICGLEGTLCIEGVSDAFNGDCANKIIVVQRKEVRVSA